MIPITNINIQLEQDILSTLRQLRLIAKQLGFNMLDQTRISAAASEILHNALEYAGGGQVEIMVDDTVSQPHLYLSIQDKGPGINNLEEILQAFQQSKTGLSGAKMLMDSFHIETTPGEGTSVQMKKNLPYHAPILTKQLIGEIQNALHQIQTEAAQDAEDQQLTKTMAALNHKQKDFMDLNQVLEYTNQEIIALYAGLEKKAEPPEELDKQGQISEIEKQKEIEGKLRLKDAYDPLTNLPRRILFFDRFKLGETRLSQSLSKGLIAVILIEISNLKSIRDKYGSAGGDEVVIVTGDRIGRRLRAHDTGARLGEGVFALLLENVPDENITKRVVEELLMLIQQPFLFEDETLFPSVNIGISIYPLHAQDLDMLLKQAEQALNYAQKNHILIQFFDPDIH